MPDQETTEPCACWWTGGSLHGGHCCFLGPDADAAFAGKAAFCHEMPAAVERALVAQGDDTPYCVHGCGRPATTERFDSVTAGGDVIVELECGECTPAEEPR